MTTLAQVVASYSIPAVEPVLFYAFALLMGLSAWAIVLARNIVRMSVFLLLTLGGAAGLYFILNAEFLAAIQLIVYAGGTLILIVFGVMLTNKNPFMRFVARPWEAVSAVVIGVVIGVLLVLAVMYSPVATGSPNPMTSGSYEHVETLGRALLTTYLVPFEVAAVLLLIVMIAAAYMARRRIGD